MAAGGERRVGHAERDAAAAALGAHYAAGRLTAQEFQARLDEVYGAVTAADLDRATVDLPLADPASARPSSRGSAGAGTGTGAETEAGVWRIGVPASLRRAAVRVLATAGLLAATAITGTVMLIAALAGHSGLLPAALVLLAVPLALTGLAAAGLIWLGRRAWRSGAWLELAPAAVGAPWLGRALWAVRLLLAGRVFWRLAGRVGRPPRRRRGDAGAGRAAPEGVWYQAEPGGEWRQARVGDLSGTSK